MVQDEERGSMKAYDAHGCPCGANDISILYLFSRFGGRAEWLMYRPSWHASKFPNLSSI